MYSQSICIALLLCTHQSERPSTRQHILASQANTLLLGTKTRAAMHVHYGIVLYIYTRQLSQYVTATPKYKQYIINVSLYCTYHAIKQN